MRLFASYLCCILALLFRIISTLSLVDSCSNLFSSFFLFSLKFCSLINWIRQLIRFLCVTARPSVYSSYPSNRCSIWSSSRASPAFVSPKTGLPAISSSLTTRSVCLGTFSWRFRWRIFLRWNWEASALKKAFWSRWDCFVSFVTWLPWWLAQNCYECRLSSPQCLASWGRAEALCFRRCFGRGNGSWLYFYLFSQWLKY